MGTAMTRYPAWRRGGFGLCVVVLLVWVVIRVADLSLSPQIEPILLDDTLKVVLDLQEHWRQGGWIPIRVEYDPPFADTPELRTRLRNINQGGTSYWQAGNEYQVMMAVWHLLEIAKTTVDRSIECLHLRKA